MTKEISLTVNGLQYTKNVDVRYSLLDFLRLDLGLTGAKEGCSVGECGACTVIVDDITVDSCIYLAVWADGKNVTTIEGVSDGENLSDVQQNFINSGAIQCGYCTPGLVMSTTMLLRQNDNPTEDEIRRGLSGNLCRCTGYTKIIDAVTNTVKGRNN